MGMVTGEIYVSEPFKVWLWFSCAETLPHYDKGGDEHEKYGRDLHGLGENKIFHFRLGSFIISYYGMIIVINYIFA